jgi:hypothetical protein
MTQSIADAFKCNQCGASYGSERELLEHQRAAHHYVVSDRKSEKENVDQHFKAKANNA